MASAKSVAKKLGFLNKSIEQTQHPSAQQGGNWWDDVSGFFGGSIQHPCHGGHKHLGITKASYNRAAKLHLQHGGAFMDWVKKIGKVAQQYAPVVAGLIPGKLGAIAQAAASLIPQDAAQQDGSGAYKGHKHYGISKAHYARAVRHHRQHGGSFWDSIKSVAKKVASVALPLARQIAPMIPGPAGMAANMALNMLAPQQEGEGLKKGSAEAKARMAHLRSLRKKRVRDCTKQTTLDKQ